MEDQLKKLGLEFSDTPPAVQERIENHGLDFGNVPPMLREQALEAYEEGDACGILATANYPFGPRIVERNVEQLKARGIYEEALLTALIGPGKSWYYYPLSELQWLIRNSDRDKFLAAGDPLPGPGPFTLYRGVGGEGPIRCVRGIFWSARHERAEWFASRAAECRLHDPAIYELEAPRSWVYAYSDARQESDFIVLVPREAKPQRCS
jgi:hypothetical protein